MKTLAIAVAGLVFAGAAQASTITAGFEEFSRGDVVSSFSVGTATATVLTKRRLGNGSNVNGQSIAFDTANPGTRSDGDPDLGAPFYTDYASGSGVTGTDPIGAAFDPGNVLIIDEESGGQNPDDNGTGGRIALTFDEAVTFDGFDVFDDVTDFMVAGQILTGSSYTTVYALKGITLDYDNQYASFGGLNWTGVDRLVFNFRASSGAIDNLDFLDPTGGPVVPVPATLPLLLAGLGAMGYAGRRRG